MLTRIAFRQRRRLALLGAAAVMLTASSAAAQREPRQISIPARIIEIDRNTVSGLRSLSNISFGLEGGFTTGGGDGTVTSTFAPPAIGSLGGTSGILRADVRTTLGGLPSASINGIPPALIAGVKIGLWDKTSESFTRLITPTVQTTLRSQNRVLATPYIGTQFTFRPQITSSGVIAMQVMPFVGIEFAREALTLTVDDGVLNRFHASQHRASVTGGVETSWVMTPLANGVTPAVGVLLQARQHDSIAFLGDTLSGFLFRAERDRRTELVVMITPRLIFPVE